MSVYCYQLLNRLIGHRVMVATHGQKMIWGTLASVSDDALRLVDTVFRDDHESGGWLEQMQFADEDGGGPRNAETLISLGAVISVTAPDEVVPETAKPVANAPATDPNATDQEPDEATDADPDPILSLVIELGWNLLQMVAGDQAATARQAIRSCRQQLATQYGIIMPCVHVRDRASLEPNGYRFLIQGHVAAAGQLHSDRLLAIGGDSAGSNLDELAGISARDPAGVESRWIQPTQVDEAKSMGMAVEEPCRVLTRHFAETVRGRLHDVITYQHVQQLISNQSRSTPEAVRDLFPANVLSRYLRLFQGLLRERVSISPLMPIVQSAAFHLEQTISEDELLRRVRIDIGRRICSPFVTESGHLAVVQLDRETERCIQDALDASEDLDELPAIASIPWSTVERTRPLALMVRRSQIRPHIAVTLTRHGESIAVIARDEVPADIRFSLQTKTPLG